MPQDVYVLIEHLHGEVAELSYVMLAAGRSLVEGTEGEVIALVFGQDVKDLTKDLAAGTVYTIEHSQLSEFTSEAYLQVLEALVQERQPRAVIAGDTSVGAGVAGLLSHRLGLPLVSSCQRFEKVNGAHHFISQICGGKIVAEGELPYPQALVTMIPGGYKADQGRTEKASPIEEVNPPDFKDQRMRVCGYLEPEEGDIDISKEQILVSAGRGIKREDNLELVEDLAESLGGAVCASRPIVDQNWLPASRLIGKSGKSVKPVLYLAMGISGAPEHIEGITSSDLIVAINTDPSAPIYKVAHYGAEIDALDLMPVLTSKVREAKGG